jgi:hypothetical protein
MNRAFSSVKAHLNVDNRLQWSLNMAALAMPVIMMDGEFDLTLSEVGMIKLPLNAKYEWTEPPGRAWTALAERAEGLKEEIYRQCYLLSQARSNRATPAMQSGISKQQDMMASKKVMNLFGDVMRMVIQRLYDFLSAARQWPDLTWDVRGLQFPEAPPDATLDMIAETLSLSIPSDLFEKEVFKLAVMAVLKDVNPRLREQIFDQIARSPSKEAQAQFQLQQNSQALLQSKVLKTDFKGI